MRRDDSLQDLARRSAGHLGQVGADMSASILRGVANPAVPGVGGIEEERSSGLDVSADVECIVDRDVRFNRFGCWGWRGFGLRRGATEMCINSLRLGLGSVGLGLRIAIRFSRALPGRQREDESDALCYLLFAQTFFERGLLCPRDALSNQVCQVFGGEIGAAQFGAAPANASGGVAIGHPARPQIDPPAGFNLILVALRLGGARTGVEIER